MLSGSGRSALRSYWRRVWGSQMWHSSACSLVSGFESSPRGASSLKPDSLAKCRSEQRHTPIDGTWRGPQRLGREDTGPVYLGCLRENPAGSKVTSPQRRIALARTPRGPGKLYAFWASSLETTRFGISGTSGVACNAMGLAHACGQKGERQATIGSKAACLGAKGCFKTLFLSLS